MNSYARKPSHEFASRFTSNLPQTLRIHLKEFLLTNFSSWISPHEFLLDSPHFFSRKSRNSARFHSKFGVISQQIRREFIATSCWDNFLGCVLIEKTCKEIGAKAHEGFEPLEIRTSTLAVVIKGCYVSSSDKRLLCPQGFLKDF